MRTRMLTMRLALAGLGIPILYLALVASPAATADPAITPIGVWATVGGGSHVKIEDCGGKLCGAIIWLKEPFNKKGKDKVDSENPDPSLRTRKIAGLALLSGFVQDQGSPYAWTGGKIYNPDDGKTYSCNLTLQDPGTLRVRGYVGLSFLGKTQIWSRVK
ncbi:DUF2147 domain-containing protein [Candidatus Binatus soli]|jgi:uncharacterized protein (DUF2147 family)|uniref:DUF2147 domain-containing protein n=1 Tax=Candidatus Binatus soli TaxID=1953413 RepID=UPI003D0F1DAB